MAVKRTKGMEKSKKGIEFQTAAAGAVIAFLIFLLVLYFWYNYVRGSGRIPTDIGQITQILKVS